MPCDQICGTIYDQGGMGCGGRMMVSGAGMMGPRGLGCHQGGMNCGMGGSMDCPGPCCGPGDSSRQQRPAYQQGLASMGFLQGPPPMGFQQGPIMGFQQVQSPMGFQQGQSLMGFQQGPATMGYPPGPFEPGSGCGGTNVTCSTQGADIPPQARVRKARPPSSTVPKRKLGTSYTTLVTPLAGARELTEEDSKNITPDHERFDTLTLAFGTKPGTNKPPKILLTLKSPKVIDAKLGTGTAGTQVNYSELGLPDPNAKPEDTKSRSSKMSRKSRASKKSSKISKKGSRKGPNMGSKKFGKRKKGKK